MENVTAVYWFSSCVFPTHIANILNTIDEILYEHSEKIDTKTVRFYPFFPAVFFLFYTAVELKQNAKNRCHPPQSSVVHIVYYYFLLFLTYVAIYHRHPPKWRRSKRYFAFSLARQKFVKERIPDISRNQKTMYRRFFLEFFYMSKDFLHRYRLRRCTTTMP